MNKILIDFAGGMHGHFLESILNALDSDSDQLINDSPFRMSDRGTCRNKIYSPWSLRFCSDHYHETARLAKHQPMIDAAEHCITINLESDYRDLVLYLRLIFGRALPPECPQPGSFSQMHINFYYKMSGMQMLPVRDYVSTRFGGLREDAPDIDIHVLRSTLMHLMSENSIIMSTLKTKVPFYRDKTQHVFMLSWFYDQEKFIRELSNLASKFSIDMGTREQRVRELHREFLSLNEFAKDSGYQRCQSVLDNLDSRDPMPELDVLDQAWILHRLQQLHNKKILYTDNEFFKTPYELNQYIIQL